MKSNRKVEMSDTTSAAWTQDNHTNVTVFIDDSVSSIWPLWSAILLSVITLTGVVGNIFIIGAVSISTRLKVQGNALVVNLAIADLIVCAYVMPMGIAMSQDHIIKFRGVLCDMNAFITLTTCGVSTQTLMLIAIERYFHVCRIDYHGRIFTPVMTGVFILITWIYTMAWTCQGWTGWTKYIDSGSSHICLVSGTYSISYSVCLAFFGMILPMIVIVICYAKIFSTVTISSKAITAHHQHNTSGLQVYNYKNTGKKKKRKHKECQLLLTLLTIVIIFLLCWLPISLILITSTVTDLSSLAYILGIWLALTSSTFNSFVYGIMNKNFRDGYKRLFKHVFCCCCGNKGCRCFVAPNAVVNQDRSSDKCGDRSSVGCDTNMSNLSSKVDSLSNVSTTQTIN